GFGRTRRRSARSGTRREADQELGSGRANCVQTAVKRGQSDARRAPPRTPRVAGAQFFGGRCQLGIAGIVGVRNMKTSVASSPDRMDQLSWPSVLTAVIATSLTAQAFAAERSARPYEDPRTAE